MTSYTLEILTPEGVAFRGPVDLLVARSPAGEFGVMAGHIPMTAAVRPGVIHAVENGTHTRWFVTSGGFLSVRRDGTRLLTERVVERPSLKEALLAFDDLRSALASPDTTD
jgi:F-type H+-transporting ATPase subunit epsilon